METLREILGLPLSDPNRAKYNANSAGKRIDQVIISGTTIKGYGAFSFLWEKSYVKSPTRSADGSIGNLNSYATFITPHLQIDFSLLFIDDYRKIMQLLYSKNEHTVQCYDIVNDRITVNNMYFATESMPVIYSVARQVQGEENPVIELLGVKDYTVEMIGTNTKLGGKTVTYYPNAPVSMSPITIDVVKGQEIIIGDGAEEIINSEPVDSNGKIWEFVRWSSTNSSFGTSYRNGDTKFIYDDTVFYAIWDFKETYTLSFNYGLGSPEIDSNGKEIYSRQIKKGEQIGSLYSSPLPTVVFEDMPYFPYERKGWYWTPQIADTSIQIKETTIYDLTGNGTIYQIFAPKAYTLTFNSNGGSAVNSITAEYGSAVAIPTPTKSGYKFGGWFYDTSFKNKFGGTIPPTNKVLYAKWVEE